MRYRAAKGLAVVAFAIWAGGCAEQQAPKSTAATTAVDTDTSDYYVFEVPGMT